MHLTDKNEISRWLICFCRFVEVIYKLILTLLIHNGETGRTGVWNAVYTWPALNVL